MLHGIHMHTSCSQGRKYLPESMEDQVLEMTLGFCMFEQNLSRLLKYEPGTPPLLLFYEIIVPSSSFHIPCSFLTDRPTYMYCAVVLRIPTLRLASLRDSSMSVS